MNPDKIADIVLAKYDALPSKSKPAMDAKGVSSWVPLSAIVLTKGKLYSNGYLLF